MVLLDVFPTPELDAESGDRPGAVGDFVELFGVGASGALDGAIERGTLGRQDEEADPGLLTRGLEGGVELRAAVAAARRTRTPGNCRQRPGE